MICTPTLLVRDIEGVAQRVPHGPRLNTRLKRGGCRPVIQFAQHLVAREGAAVGGAEYLIDELPKFS